MSELYPLPKHEPLFNALTGRRNTDFETYLGTRQSQAIATPTNSTTAAPPMTMPPTIAAPGAPIAAVIGSIQAPVRNLSLALQEKPTENLSALPMSLALQTLRTQGPQVGALVSRGHSLPPSSLTAGTRGTKSQARLLGMLIAEIIGRMLNRLGSVTSATFLTTSWKKWIR